jgi:hypothetical protein
MKLYLVSRTDLWSYDDYDSFVVAAESEENAKSYHPRGHLLREPGYSFDYDYCWTSRENLKVEHIGESNSLVEKVIISSFNAG